MAPLLGECLLLDILEKRDMTPADFARAMKCSPSYVSQLISGISFMTLEFAIEASHRLNCQVTDFYVINIGGTRRSRSKSSRSE